MSGAKLEAVGDAPALTRYGAKLVIPPDQKQKVALLNALIWCYVIDSRIRKYTRDG